MGKTPRANGIVVLGFKTWILCTLEKTILIKLKMLEND